MNKKLLLSILLLITITFVYKVSTKQTETDKLREALQKRFLASRPCAARRGLWGGDWGAGRLGTKSPVLARRGWEALASGTQGALWDPGTEK